MPRFFVFRLVLALIVGVQVWLALYHLDLFYYQADKYSLMEISILRGSLAESLPSNSRMVNLLNGYYETIGANTSKAEAARQIETTMRDHIERASIIVRLELMSITGDPTPMFRVDNEAKQVANNGFPDALFLSNFRKRAVLAITDGNGNTRGRWMAYYTTLPGNPEIQALTWRYVWIAIAFVPILIIPYAIVELVLLRPVAHVLRVLEVPSRYPNLERPPRSELSRRYNDLARDALLLALERHLREPRRRLQLGDDYDVYRAMAGLAPALMGYESAALVVGHRAASGANTKWHPAMIAHTHRASTLTTPADGQLEFPAARTWRADEPAKEGEEHLDADSLASLRAWIDSDEFAGATERPRGEAEVGRHPFSLVALDDEKLQALLGHSVMLLTAPDRERPGHNVVWIFGWSAADAAAFNSTQIAWERDTIERLLALLDSLLGDLALQRLSLVRERSEANVSLARHLGHDLTNIIATTKLDMLALERLVPKLTQSAPTRDARLLRESMESLQANATFMQEIVNVYRSFSYLKRPTYEPCDINKTIEEIVILFERATGLPLTINRRYADDLPRVVIEPRLIKLATFNVLTNARDALRRAAEEKSNRPPAMLTVSTFLIAGTKKKKKDQEPARVAIRIEDNGPGIRDAQGRLLDPDELHRLFSLGYSTKTSQEGEGLGLNWVWTILHDFHHGRVVPKNQPGGGAQFTLEIPVERP